MSPSGTETSYISSSSVPDGLCVHSLVVRWPLPCPKVTGVAIHVSPPCYSCPMVRNRQIHVELGVPLYAENIRTLTARFDKKLADVENPLVRQLDRYLRWPTVDPVAIGVSQGQQEPAGQSRQSFAMGKSTKWIALSADQPSNCWICWLRYTVIFLSCNTSARVYDVNSGHGPHSLPHARRLHLSAWQSRYWTEPVWARNPDSQKPKFIPLIIKNLACLGMLLQCC